MATSGTTTTGRLTPRGPFSLAAGRRFLEGFTPAAHDGGGGDHLHLAFAVEGTWATAGACARQDGDGDGDDVTVEVTAPDERVGVAAVRQVERILSLDVDGTGFPEVGRRDPVVGALQARGPGLRPVGFWSPYEAAAWALIGNRIRITQAAALKASMAAQLGEPVTVHGDALHAFPAPGRLRTLDGFPGLTGRKAEYLRALADAALAGRLDAAALRAVPRDQALASLRELPGIGPFAAELTLLRGAGDPDAAPVAEPRLRRAVAHAYGLPAEPSEEHLATLTDGWRPYRTWVTLLLRIELEAATGEIAGGGRRRA